MCEASIGAACWLLTAVLAAADYTPPPRAGEWQYTGEMVSYDRATVFDLINGEAAIYFPYGFKRVDTITYAADAAPGECVDAEVYEMGSPLDAFGIYAEFRGEDDELVPLGRQGFAGSTMAMFHQDRYFVKLRFNKPRENKPALMAVGKALAKALAKKTPPPPGLRILEAEGVLPNTARYVLNGVLGYGFFPRGLTARARLDEKPFHVFVVLCKEPAQAKQAMDKYVAHLRKSRADYEWNGSPEGPVLAAKDPGHGDLVIQQSGPFLVGVTGEAGEMARGRRLLVRLVHKVHKVHAP